MFPFIRQYDNMQCGVACLAMICKYFGFKYSINSLSNICSPTTEGVSLLGLSESATKIGFDTSAVKISVNDLNNSMVPCIRQSLLASAILSN